MGNLRPAPVALNPQRIDALIDAFDDHEGQGVLRRLGLSNDEIKAVIRLARKHRLTPIALVAALVRTALEATEARG